MSHAEPDQPEADEPDEVPTEPLLVVLVGERSFALPLEGVLEVVPSRPFARLPGAPAAVRGVVNVRGRVVTVIDLGAALEVEPATASADHRVLVLAHDGRQVGIAVSEVARIARVPLAELAEAPGGAAPGWVRATTMLEEREVPVLAADALLRSILS
jgi:purine-binding chemotaxis protein CheW